VHSASKHKFFNVHVALFRCLVTHAHITLNVSWDMQKALTHKDSQCACTLHTEAV
jgi:hypothetical protein